jgi:hypothetical protein
LLKEEIFLFDEVRGAVFRPDQEIPNARGRTPTPAAAAADERGLGATPALDQWDVSLEHSRPNDFLPGRGRGRQHPGGDNASGDTEGIQPSPGKAEQICFHGVKFSRPPQPEQRWL